MSEYWLILLITFALEVVAIAIVAVFGMTFICKAFDKMIGYIDKKWGTDVSFGVSCAIILIFLFTTLAVVFH
mgnify:CR=1 FL=1